MVSYQFSKCSIALLTLHAIGDIIELSVFGSTIIIINTAEDAYKLMEKRGNNYSDRPRICLQGEL